MDHFCPRFFISAKSEIVVRRFFAAGVLLAWLDIDDSFALAAKWSAAYSSAKAVNLVKISLSHL
jgi:hypothetical protein